MEQDASTRGPRAGPQATRLPAGRWACTGPRVPPPTRRKECAPQARSSSFSCPGAPAPGPLQGRTTGHEAHTAVLLITTRPTRQRGARGGDAASAEVPASPSGSTHRTPHGAAGCAACTAPRGPRCSCAPASRCPRSPPRRAPGGTSASAPSSPTALPGAHPSEPQSRLSGPAPPGGLCSQVPRAVPSPPRAVTEDPGRRRFCSPISELSSARFQASRMRNRTRGVPEAWGSLPRSSDLAEALDQRVLLRAQPDGVAVAHGQVDLSAMAPERGGVRGDPVRKQPAEEHVGRRSRPPPAPATQPRPTWARPPARHSHTPTVLAGSLQE